MRIPRSNMGRGLLLLVLLGLSGVTPALAQYEQGDSRQDDIEVRELVSDEELTRGRLDLNRASLEEIRELPIPVEVADAIYEYRTYRAYFASIYDLKNVDGVTPEMIQALQPLVATMPPKTQDDWIRRYTAAFRQIQQFQSREGASEELQDEYKDQLLEPRNINDLSLYALQSYQNVSPIDATAILKARERNEIQNQRQLRGSEGLSYWAYRNLRDYVVYEPVQDNKEFHGYLQLRAYNTPYLIDDDEILHEPFAGAPPENIDEGTPWGIKHLDSANPAVMAKLKLKLGRTWKGGVMTFRNVGERNMAETVKAYLAWHKDSSAKVRLDNVVIGNFRLAFGQGLVMDNTDYYLSRKTGTGFNKRPLGILGDVSRSYEFALRGVAAEGTLGPVQLVGFFSKTEKDGILNLDENGNPISINKYIIGWPRYEDDEYETMNTAIRRRAFDETTFGGLARWQFLPGTYVGISGYEAQHDLPWDPNPATLVTEVDRLEARDNEIIHAYDSTELGNFRRVLGAEFQAVYENIAFQGEYAKLDANPNGGIFSNAPDAMVFTGYTQFSNLNFFALYRNYDVGFDNPYSRGFSQDNRYEQTLLGDPFRLNSPLYSWLETRNAQAKAEEGIFISSRYRISRQITTSVEFDTWERKADGQSLRRYTVRGEYAPVWPVRFRVRQRYSDRAPEELSDNRRFESWDTRLEMRARLTQWDELRLLYSNTNTQFASRPRLTGPAVPPGDGNVGNPLPQGASPGQAIQGVLVHNVNDRLQFTLSGEIYDGFLWNYEDTEFIVIDGQGVRTWFLVQSRVSDHLLLRFKMTHDRQKTINNYEVRQFSNSDATEFRSGGKNEITAFRLELDYNF